MKRKWLWVLLGFGCLLIIGGIGLSLLNKTELITNSPSRYDSWKEEPQIFINPSEPFVIIPKPQLPKSSNPPPSILPIPSVPLPEPSNPPSISPMPDYSEYNQLIQSQIDFHLEQAEFLERMAWEFEGQCPESVNIDQDNREWAHEQNWQHHLCMQKVSDLRNQAADCRLKALQLILQLK